MSNITDKLNTIKTAKENIKSSIEAKGVEVGDVSLEEYASKIDELKTTNLKITDGRYLFHGGARTDYMNEIFSLCEKIQNAIYMFYSCPLEEIDLSNLDLSEVTNTSYMFNSSYSLKKVIFSNATKMKNLGRMFMSCSNLQELDMSKVSLENATDIGYMFSSCSNITNFKSFKSLGKGFTQKASNYTNYKLDLSSNSKLTYESLIDLITNGLYDLNLTYDVANGGTLYTQSLVIGATNKAKLSAEEIAIATNKRLVSFLKGGN